MNWFHYSKKLFIHYILVPGRQVPFLVRGGHGPHGPHGKIAYDNGHQLLAKELLKSDSYALRFLVRKHIL